MKNWEAMARMNKIIGDKESVIGYICTWAWVHKVQIAGIPTAAFDQQGGRKAFAGMRESVEDFLKTHEDAERNGNDENEQKAEEVLVQFLESDFV